jgi:hypothetical protein
VARLGRQNKGTKGDRAKAHPTVLLLHLIRAFK